MSDRKFKTVFFFILILFAIPGILGQVEQITIMPSKPNPGDVVTITIQSKPNMIMNITIKYNGSLIVSESEFTFTFPNFEIPENIEALTIKAEPVELLRVTVIQNGIPITQTIQGMNSIANISQNNISPGVHWVQLSGVSHTDVEKVSVNVEVRSSIITDYQGVYSIEYNSTGFPPGEIYIYAGNHVEHVSLGVVPTMTPRNIVIIPQNIPEKLTPGQDYTFTYLIINEGHLVNDLLIEFLVDDEIVNWENISQLMGNTSYLYELKWNPEKSGSYNILVFVDPHNTVNETSEDDNISQLMINVEESNSYPLLIGLLLGIIIVIYLIQQRANLS
jgi:hypothetical protein